MAPPESSRPKAAEQKTEYNHGSKYLLNKDHKKKKGQEKNQIRTQN